MVAIAGCFGWLHAQLSAAAGTPPLFHVESPSGGVLASESADVPFNPASVVKIATTEWALEQLGPAHRFETRFGFTGRIDEREGRVDGDLVVVGGADPDFHIENAYLVARALNELGIREVTGDLRVDDRFWIGWEGGSEKREHDRRLRAASMATRLRDAWDPDRWSPAQRRAIEEFTARRGFPDRPVPRVVVRGDTGLVDPDVADTELVVHMSNPLVKTLKRFNAYSNNDIERFGASLGSAADLERRLRHRWGASREQVKIASLSGLGVNRLTPRLVVRLLRDLAATCQRGEIDLADVLPVAGCDPGTLSHFPDLDEGSASRALVGKTGSLNSTDGGVAVLAGQVGSTEGARWFCVATTGAGGHLAEARAAHERWLMELIKNANGPRPRECREPVVFSDDSAEVLPADEALP